MGTTLCVYDGLHGASRENEIDFGHIALVAKNNTGYHQLMRIISKARIEQEMPCYHVTLDDIVQEINGSESMFLVLCHERHKFYNHIIQSQTELAREILTHYKTKLGPTQLLVELLFPTAELDDRETKRCNDTITKLCAELTIRTIVSSAPRYLETTQTEAYRVICAIKSQCRLDTITESRSQHLYSVEELKTLFADYPEALETADLEALIDVQIRFDFDKHADEAYFPNYDLPDAQDYSGRLIWDTYLNFLIKFHYEKLDRAEWEVRYPYSKLDELKRDAATFELAKDVVEKYEKDHFLLHPIQEYVERIEYELGIIIQKGYPSYFLVFGDIMQFCRDNGIVAATRGSAAGSLVGWLNNINILDPLVYNLPFERFLNPLRPSAPDIDGDFADDRRHEVIEYIKQKWGADKVTQIITFGTMLPRAAVRDVGRVLGVGYKKCDTLSKLIPTAPQGKKTTFEWALAMSDELRGVYETDAEVQRIINIAKILEGNYRHASQHAAGVVISPTPMSDFAPLQWDSDHVMPIIQYDMRNSEKAGLIKLDILGIRNLSILGNAVDLVEKRRDKKIIIFDVDVHDAPSFSLLAKGRTMGIFQLSGPAMTRYLVNLEPTRVEDLQAMVALYRPGPMGNIPDYIARKKNPKKIKYYVPQMEEWMKASFGVLVYQDDLLYTVINLAGYDWGMADVFRKGVGKKIPEVLDSQHEIFVSGAIEHSGLTREKAEEIWAIMVPFAAYGFNKAHASNYGMIAYWTAYMKANFPAEFMSALMSAESNNLDKTAAAIRECMALGLTVSPPDINKSFEDFFIQDDVTILYGLNSVKNLGVDVIKYMIAERVAGGRFETMYDFLERMALCRGFNKRSLEALIWSGALDELGAREYAAVMA